MRLRVEKASLPMHQAALEPLSLWIKAQEAKPVKKRRDLPPELAAAMRPKVRRFLELCDRHQVNFLTETTTLDQTKTTLRKAFKLAPEEPW